MAVVTKNAPSDFDGSKVDISKFSEPKQLSGGAAMSPKAIGILSVAGMCVFVGAYYLVGHMLILYLLFATAVLLGPILFLVGLHKLYARLSKRLRCKEETQGYVVDYILSPWKYANPHRRPHRSRNYYYRWFPVVEYEVDGQRLRQKNKKKLIRQDALFRCADTIRYVKEELCVYSLRNYS